MLLLDIDNLDI